VSRMIGCGDIDSLSRRELEVVRHAGEGLANKDIADKMGLSEHTVKNYLFRAFEKVGVSSRVELLFYMLRHDKVAPIASAVTESELLASSYKAAEEGFVTAQFRVGSAHFYGTRGEKNAASAYHWLSLAQQNAEEILLESRQILGLLKKTMTPQAIQEAELSLASDRLRRRSKTVLSVENKDTDGAPPLTA
jgi:DNA-binding CsgD family transcriptional regulator